MMRRPKLLLALAGALCLTMVATPGFSAPTPNTASAPPVTSAPAPAPTAANTPAPVPLRLISEAIGGEVTWDEASRTVTVMFGPSKRFSVTIGRTAGTVDGKPVSLTEAPAIVGDRTVVPLSFFTETLGMGPGAWDDARAVGFISALSQGQGESWTAQFTPELAASLPAPVMQAVGASLQQQVGAITRVMITGHTANAVHDSVEMRVIFAKLPMTAAVRFTPAGMLDDFSLISPANLVPPAGTPGYARPDTYTEREVVLGQGTFALPGTLTIPTGTGPFPAIVLVPGSGPNDRDETLGAVKVFRDLADGLASRGIAVLRFEKRTREHGQKTAGNPRFTLQDETIADAVTAISFLGKQSQIDPKRIFALGHSLGGFALPQILSQAKDPAPAGGIIMAGPNSMFDTIIEQNQILIDAGLAPLGQMPFIKSQLAMLADPSFDPANPPAGFALGSPYYYASWRGAASDFLKDVTIPLLFLQGERDCQVPVSQLQSWTAALSGRANVTYHRYPKLNHIFTEGEGAIGLPAEYDTPANVPEYVVNDLANWISGK